MADPSFMSFKALALLFDPEFVAKQKISTIKTVRQITGEGLKETKDWVENFLQPTVVNMSHNQLHVTEHMPDFDPDEILQQLESLRRDVADLKQEKVTNQAKEIF